MSFESASNNEASPFAKAIKGVKARYVAVALTALSPTTAHAENISCYSPDDMLRFGESLKTLPDAPTLADIAALEVPPIKNSPENFQTCETELEELSNAGFLALRDRFETEGLNDDTGLAALAYITKIDETLAAHHLTLDLTFNDVTGKPVLTNEQEDYLEAYNALTKRKLEVMQFFIDAVPKTEETNQ